MAPDAACVRRPPSLTAVSVIIGLAVAACGGSESVGPASGVAIPIPLPKPTVPATPSRQALTPDPAAEISSRQAYSDAICPALEATALLDLRLAELRAAGAVGGDFIPYAHEIASVAEELRIIVNELQAVPDWTSGRLLRDELILALRQVRTALLRAAGDLDGSDPGALLAAVPYVARPAMDLEASRAVDAGFRCAFD